MRATTVIAGLLAAGLAAAGAWTLLSPAPEAQSERTVLQRGNQDEPDTLDPHRATGSWENNILGDLFIGLTTEDAAGKPVPGAATAWTVSPDGLTYTFTLRDHVWSDGVPVTADDFVFSFRRALDPETASDYASILFVIRNGQAANTRAKPLSEIGVRAIDARTLEITLENPAPFLPELLMHTTALPVPKHQVETLGADWLKPGTMASNGPFTLAEWTANDKVRIVKNPRFFAAETVAIDEVIYTPTSDQVAALKRFRAGELDVNRGFPSSQLDWMRANLPEALRISPILNTRHIVFNVKRAPFDDQRVREAVAMAIDREVLAEQILRAGEVPSYALVPAGIAGYPATAQHRFKGIAHQERIAEARRLLAEAGFTDAQPLRFSFNYISDTDSRRVAAALQEMWAAAGIAVELVVSDKKNHYNLLRSYDYAIAESNWIADFNDAINFLYLARGTSGPMNVTQWSDPRFDALLDRADREADAGERAALMAEAEQIMLDAVPITPLYQGVSRHLVSPRVSGWQDNVSDVHRTRYLTLTPR